MEALRGFLNKETCATHEVFERHMECFQNNLMHSVPRCEQIVRCPDKNVDCEMPVRAVLNKLRLGKPLRCDEPTQLTKRYDDDANETVYGLNLPSRLFTGGQQEDEEQADDVLGGLEDCSVYKHPDEKSIAEFRRKLIAEGPKALIKSGNVSSGSVTSSSDDSGSGDSGSRESGSGDNGSRDSGSVDSSSVK